MGSGTFVALEGVEGAGKTTQLRLLAEWLGSGGVDPVLVREPGGTPLAEDVRSLLLHAAHDVSPNAEALLFQVARADLVARVIRPALAAGQVVLADRFELSTRCYQVAGRGLDAAQVGSAIALATGGLAPDAYLVLDLDPAAGRSRQSAEGKGPDRIERADAAFHERVAEAFRQASGPTIEHLSAAQEPGALHAEIRGILIRRFPAAFGGLPPR